MQFGLQLERFSGRGVCRMGLPSQTSFAAVTTTCTCTLTSIALFSQKTMSGQDAFRRFAQQVQRAGGSGGRVPPGGAGLVAGTIALIGGAALLNASLFNGEYTLRLFTFYES